MTARDIAALFDALELDLVKSLHRCLARHQRQEQTEGGQNGTPRHWQTAGHTAVPPGKHRHPG